MEAMGFASRLLAKMRQLDWRAEKLVHRPLRRGKQAELGVNDEGEFVPLLRLGAASAKFNVMTVFVPVAGAWGEWLPLPRGTPAELAQRLTTDYRHFWLSAAIMAEPPEKLEK